MLAYISRPSDCTLTLNHNVMIIILMGVAFCRHSLDYIASCLLKYCEWFVQEITMPPVGFPKYSLPLMPINSINGCG